MFRICAALACALALIVSTALGATPPREKELGLTMAYLERVQNLDGGYGGRPGAESDPMFSAWVAYALASGGTNPQDQAVHGGVDAFSYLAANTADLHYTTDWARVLLVTIVAGTPPRDFGGTDPVARILERVLPDGSFPHEPGGRVGGVNDTAFAVLAFSRVDDPAGRAAIPAAVDWLLSVQREDGAWGHAPRSGHGADMTGAVIQALIAGGRGGTEAQRRGFEYIRTLQHDNGGITMNRPGSEPNVASTAWSVQAMWAAGIDPASWRRAGGDPLDYMAGMQQPDGSIRWMASSNDNPIWMTAEVAPAFAGHPLPVPYAPRKIVASPTPTATATATPTGTPASETGQGGSADGPSEGVRSGGGGAGAPLFSQPKPQSQGRTRGGVRRPERERGKPRATPTPRPGTSPRAGTKPRATATPTPTATAAGSVAAVTPTATPTPTPTPTCADPAATPLGLGETSSGVAGVPGTASSPGAAVPGAAASSGAATSRAAASSGASSPCSSPSSSGPSRDGTGPSLAGEPGGTGAGSGAGSSLPYVRGTIVSETVEVADVAAAAPGLRGAGGGGTDTDAARLIAAALLIALACGWTLERRATVVA